MSQRKTGRNWGDFLCTAHPCGGCKGASLDPVIRNSLVFCEYIPGWFGFVFFLRIHRYCKNWAISELHLPPHDPTMSLHPSGSIYFHRHLPIVPELGVFPAPGFSTGILHFGKRGNSPPNTRQSTGGTIGPSRIHFPWVAMPFFPSGSFSQTCSLQLQDTPHPQCSSSPALDHLFLA